MNKKYLRSRVIILAAVLVLVIALNVAIDIFESYANNYLGYGRVEVRNNENAASYDPQYNRLDYANASAVTAAAERMSELLEAEGIVLMKNNGTLPLSGRRVTLLGRSAADPVFGGAGSGSVRVDTAVTAKAGLEAAGFTINETVFNLLANFARGNSKANIVMDNPGASSYTIGEMPVSGYTQAALATFADFNDAAIVFIGRGGGEGGDLALDMNGWDANYRPGQHQLQLNLDELQTIALAKEHFNNVVVIINASNTMELGVLENDPGVDAILWIGSVGQAGFNAVGQALTGAVNPSGRTADIYPADFSKDPTFVNFGDFAYTNATPQSFFVHYEEGIYYGYRYYETAAAERFINYNEAVVYPFGYGLSYTTFDWKIKSENLGGVNGSITVEVDVTNTGRVAGKDVVQLYYSAPYTRGGIEKSSVVLGDFAKTSLLQPGQTETVTLSIRVEEMASYDYKVAKAYVLERGDYQILIQENSHRLKGGISPITYTVRNTVTYSGGNYRQSDKRGAVNRFDDVSAMFTDTPTNGMILNFSRADFAGTFPTAPTPADRIANADVLKALGAYDVQAANRSSLEMPITGADNGLGLIDLRGLDYDDPLWNLLLDQLTVENMLTVILNGAYHTEPLPEIGKPATVDLDGPAGFTSFMGSVNSTAYPSAVVIASAFSKELAYEWGVMIGNDALANNINGWYAPGINLHRSPFAGRNFEYYSEDPLHSGIIAAEVISGAQSKGIVTYLKHYALNDQETNRVANGVATWANEQAIREIYLKAFEIPSKQVKSSITFYRGDDRTTRDIGLTGMMSSFNRIGAVWAGGSYPLMTEVLRDEWGFRGSVITDFNLFGYMFPDQAVRAGTDFMLTFTPMKQMEDSTSAAAVTNLRKSMHNVLYAVTNSNAMNGIAPGSTIIVHMATWRVVQIIANIVIGLVLILSALLVIRKAKRG